MIQKTFNADEILLESWKKLKKNFKSLIIILLIIWGTIAVFNVILLQILNLISIEIGIKTLISTIIITTTGILSLLTIIITTAYTIKNDNSTNIKETFLKSLSKLIPVTWTILFKHILIILLMLPLMLATLEVVFQNAILSTIISLLTLLTFPLIIYLIINWIFTIFVVIFNNKSGIEALKHSKQIVKERWVTVLAYSIAFTIIPWFLLILISIIPNILFSINNILFATNNIVSTIGNIIISIIIMLCILILFTSFITVETVFFINFESTKK